MKQYLYSIVTTSVISALCGVLCPDGTALKKYFSFLTSAVLLCATVTPLASITKGFFDNSGIFTKIEQTANVDYSAVWQESLSSVAKEEADRAVRDHICQEFKISERNVTVDCSFSQREGGPSLTSIDVTLSSEALMKNPRRIESYISENFGVPCTVADGSVLPSE